MTPFLFGQGEVRLSSARASNGKYALVQRVDGWIELFTVDGKHVKTLPRAIRSDTQPVWSRTDPDDIFTIEGREVLRHNIAVGLSMVVASFDYASLSSSHAEGDLTPDGWLALCGVDEQGVEHAFAYNVDTGEKGDVRQFRPGEIDGLKAAKDGWLLVSGERGIQAYQRVGQSHPVAAANGHACSAVWRGRPVLVWCSAADPSIDDNAVVIIDIETGNDGRKLKSFPWAYAFHISGEIVSAYDPTGELPYQIWRCPFDGSTPELLFEWRAPYLGYESQPRATISEGLVMFGMNGSVCGLATDVVVPAEPIQRPRETRIDYSAYIGREFVMRPRPDGAIDIYEREKS